MSGRDANQLAVCRHCGTAVEFKDNRWRAVESRYPNDAHCHYSATDGKSVGHEPEDGDA